MSMNSNKPSKKDISLFLALVLFMFFHVSNSLCLATPPPLPPSYVGSQACKPCHETEFEIFVTHAKKSRSYQSIERLEKGLTENDLKKCYACHTTGYGKPGGFTSLEETPHLKDAGCEVCHGPGSTHILDKSLDSIIQEPTLQLCNTCHTSERIKAFRFKPLIHGGGH